MLRPARKQAEDVAEVRPGLDAVELAGGEERGEGGVDRAPLVATDEDLVLAADGFAAQRELAHVVVNRQPTVVEEAGETDALVARGGPNDGNALPMILGLEAIRPVRHQRAPIAARAIRGPPAC